MFPISSNYSIARYIITAAVILSAVTSAVIAKKTGNSKLRSYITYVAIAAAVVGVLHYFAITAGIIK